MKKIGILDFFLNNYHANNYPKWFDTYSGGAMKITSAYALTEDPEREMSNEEWSSIHNIPLAESVEQVIEESDVLMVLAPSHPETHERLGQKALTSGKKVYIDKAFAPDVQTAKRMFALAAAFHTPCCSSSALRFVSEYKRFDTSQIQCLSTRGGGNFEVYAIHQFEPIVALMGQKPTRIMSVGTQTFPAFLIEFADGRVARMEQFMNDPFSITVGYTDGTHVTETVETDMFKNFILHVIDFFETGNPIADPWQTVSVIGLLEGARLAQQNPLAWVAICE